SKSLEETWEFWDKAEAMERAVRILRTERPHVIITNHRVGEGHGNHQAMAQLIEEAIPLAASPEAYVDQIEEGLVPWQVERLFQRRRHHEGVPVEEYDVQVPVGLMEMIRGFSYQEIAGEALLRHRSQGAKGIWQWINARRSQSPYNYFYLTVGDPPLGPFEDLFDGMDNCWWTREGRKPFSHEGLINEHPSNEDKRRTGLSKALQALRPDLNKVEEALVDAMQAVQALPAEVDRPANWMQSATGEVVDSSEARERYQIEVIDRMQALGREEKQIQRLLSQMWGIDARVIPSEKSPFPGQEFEIEIQLTNRGSDPVSVTEYRLELPKGWDSAPRSMEIGEIASLGSARAAFWVQVATDETLTLPETDELYRSSTPWQPNVHAVAYLKKGETPGLAEVEDRLEISPAWEVWISPEETLVPLHSTEQVDLSIETRRHREVD
ncbi:MAG: PIG-L family deacetylase, partial [Candidatus Omnitrophica bacterium]|nr:PIG-L family deacetylase [Candidatus Omnitrophota bacterium]